MTKGDDTLWALALLSGGMALLAAATCPGRRLLAAAIGLFTSLAFGLLMLCMVALTLAGCASTPPPEPRIRIVETKVPVDDPACVRAGIARLGPEPAYPDTPEAIHAAKDIEARERLILAARELRRQRHDAVNAVLQECAK